MESIVPEGNFNFSKEYLYSIEKACSVQSVNVIWL